MKVLLDLNILGKGFAAPATRTGIFRATEGLAHALLDQTEVSVACAAQASWVSELQLLSYARARGTRLSGRIVRGWEQPGSRDEEGQGLIDAILALEAEGKEARRERSTLMLLNATARPVPLPGDFDVVHSLRTALPDPGRVPARVRALTVHDLIPLSHPEWSYEGAEQQARDTMESLNPLGFVLANSETTARDVRAMLSIPAERIFVTPFAADPGLFYPLRDPDRLAMVGARYGIPAGRYLLSLCTLEPRKNLPHLVRCFFRLLDRNDAGDLHLVLAGAQGWKVQALLEALVERPELRSRVILTGPVLDADLAALYSGAAAFVCPSLYEGFGLPVLEAMQCGTPVVTSTAGALPEVAGSAAIAVPPTDADALCEALRTILSDGARADELRNRGLRRATSFTWEQTAALTVQAYRRMLDLSA